MPYATPPKRDVVVDLKELYEEATVAHNVFAGIALRSEVDEALVNEEAALWREACGTFAILDSVIDLKKADTRKGVHDATRASENYLKRFRKYVLLFG